MSQKVISNGSTAGTIFTTEHRPGISAEKLGLQEVAEAVKKLSIPDSKQTNSGNPAGDGEQRVSKTMTVESKHRQKFLEQGFQVPDVLARHVVLNERDYPWRTIGKVFVGRDNNFDSPIWTGSGVLVGRNILLTAGHVAPWNTPGWWMRFVPAYKGSDNGGVPEPYGSSYVETFWGYHQDGEVNGLDYVVCKLYTLLGDTVGWMGSYSFGDDDGYYNGSWTSVGYPAEPANPYALFMIVEDAVKIVDVDDEGSEGKELESDLYSLGGWSGGPLWAYMTDQPKVVGVMSGDETDFLQPRHTVSAGGIAMVHLIQWAWANWFV